FALYSMVLVPAWKNPRFRAGLLPPRVMARLTTIAAVALVVAFAGSILSLLQQSMVFFNAGLDRVIAQGLWGVVRVGSRFGDVWNARIVLLLLIAGLVWAAHYFRERQPESVRAFWTAGTWVAALLLGSLSVASHAAGSPVWPWAAIFVDWAHTLAVGFWAGALAVLVLVLPVALRPYEGELRRKALLAPLRRFSPLATASLVVVIATGIYSAANWVREPGQITSSYGLTLVLKGVLVLALVALGAIHHITLRPERYARFRALAARARHFLPTLRWEAVIACAVLVAAALLSATPIPRPANAGDSAPDPSQTLTLGDLNVTATISPGGPGVNSYDVVVRRGETPVDDLDVFVQFAAPERDWRGPWHRAEHIGDGLYTATGDDLDRTGDWWLLISVGGVETALAWEVREDPATLAVFQPVWTQFLALAGVIAALAFAAFPMARRFYRRLDLRPATVTVAIGATLATIGIVVGGIALMQTTEARYQALTNPPPARINPVLPDAASIQRGAAAFEAACAGWLDQEAVFNSLLSRLNALRDEALYALLEEGWRTLPPCEGQLSEQERWDIVNYVRTLELQAVRANQTEEIGA
ncbi:MAG: CopD family protein, partial [Chloroflexota bacterium]